ncbi:hypothetical protein FKM82_011395 [Ascaphus truei]
MRLNPALCCSLRACDIISMLQTEQKTLNIGQKVYFSIWKFAYCISIQIIELPLCHDFLPTHVKLNVSVLHCVTCLWDLGKAYTFS